MATIQWGARELPRTVLNFGIPWAIPADYSAEIGVCGESVASGFWQHKQQYADHVHGQLRIEDRNGLAFSAVKTLMLVSAGPGHYYDKSCCGDGRRRRIPYSTLVKRKKWSR